MNERRKRSDYFTELQAGYSASAFKRPHAPDNAHDALHFETAVHHCRLRQVSLPTRGTEQRDPDRRETLHFEKTDGRLSTQLVRPNSAAGSLQSSWIPCRERASEQVSTNVLAVRKKDRSHVFLADRTGSWHSMASVRNRRTGNNRFQRHCNDDAPAAVARKRGFLARAKRARTYPSFFLFRSLYLSPILNLNSSTKKAGIQRVLENGSVRELHE